MKPLDHAKKMARELRAQAGTDFYTHSQAQAAMARILGYRDWHHLRKEANHQPGDTDGRRQRLFDEVAAVGSPVDVRMLADRFFPQGLPKITSTEAYDDEIVFLTGFAYGNHSPEKEQAVDRFKDSLGIDARIIKREKDSIWQIEGDAVPLRMADLKAALAALADAPGATGTYTTLKNAQGEITWSIRKRNGAVMSVVRTNPDVHDNDLTGTPFYRLTEKDDTPSFLVIRSERGLHSIEAKMEFDYPAYEAGLLPGHVYRYISPHETRLPSASPAHAAAIAASIDDRRVHDFGLDFLIDDGKSTTRMDPELYRAMIDARNKHAQSERKRFHGEWSTNPPFVRSKDPRYGRIDAEDSDPEIRTTIDYTRALLKNAGFDPGDHEVRDEKHFTDGRTIHGRLVPGGAYIDETYDDEHDFENDRYMMLAPEDFVRRCVSARKGLELAVTRGMDPALAPIWSYGISLPLAIHLSTIEDISSFLETATNDGTAEDIQTASDSCTHPTREWGPPSNKIEIDNQVYNHDLPPIEMVLTDKDITRLAVTLRFDGGDEWHEFWSENEEELEGYDLDDYDDNEYLLSRMDSIPMMRAVLCQTMDGVHIELTGWKDRIRDAEKKGFGVGSPLSDLLDLPCLREANCRVAEPWKMETEHDDDGVITIHLTHTDVLNTHLAIAHDDFQSGIPYDGKYPDNGVPDDEWIPQRFRDQPLSNLRPS